MDDSQVEILLIEDNSGDVRLTIEALKEQQINNNLHVVNDGEEALAFLRNEGAYAAAPRPHLIFLDLNLPKRHGREVLAEIKNDERLKRIPVIVLTTSKSDEDIAKSYDLHANCYIIKPADFERFVEIIHSIKEFWFSVAVLPDSSGNEK